MSKKTSLKFFFLFLTFVFFLVIAKDVLANWVLTSEGELLFESPLQVLGVKKEKVTVSQPVREPKKIRLERRGYQIKATLEDESGEVIEVPGSTESAEFEIEEPKEKKTVRVRSLENSYAVIRDRIAAQTHFPLMVNLETKELIVTTPAGQKTVTVLPDQAVKNMLAANVLDQIGGKGGLRWEAATPTPTPEEAPPATEAGEEKLVVAPEAPPVENVISLTTTNEGVLAYEIPGVKHEKFLGFVKVMLKRTAVVSAETGELLSIKEDFLARILDLFSF